MQGHMHAVRQSVRPAAGQLYMDNTGQHQHAMHINLKHQHVQLCHCVHTLYSSLLKIMVSLEVELM